MNSSELNAQNVSESPEFCLHIHNLLHDYATTHLTSNYLTLTEDFVCEFIAYLQPVPLRNTYSLALEVDPFQTFSDLHRLSLIKSYDEVAQTTKEALAYLKQIMSSVPRKPLTERIAWSDCYGSSSPPDPFIPALSRRSRKATPKLGKKRTKQRPAETLNRLVNSQRIKPVIVDPIKDDVLVIEDILNLKHKIVPEEAPAVRSLLKTTANMLQAQKSYKNRYLDFNTMCEITNDEPTWPEEAFVVLFPKSRIPGSGINNPDGILPELSSILSIPTVITEMVPVEEPDGDLSRQNLVVVDGWETIRSSPPSTPISEYEEDQIDELNMVSSPATEPLTEEIANSKLEPILIPRSRKIGGKSGIAPHILAKKTLNTFLQPLLKSKALFVEVSHANIEETPPSPTPSSLLGQPPSNLEEAIEDKGVHQINLQEEDLDVELKVLYESHGLGNYIMKETLDDQQDIFMEVPTLQPPNIHPPNDLHLPQSFSELLLPSTTDGKNKIGLDKQTAHLHHRFLKKVRGRESLALALSWVPFTVDKKLPSTSELIGVADLFDENQMASEVNQLKLGKLLNSIEISDEDTSEIRWANFDTNAACPVDISDVPRIMLTRQERRRLAKLEGKLDASNLKEELSDYLNALSVPNDPGEYADVDRAARDLSSDDEIERPTKRPRLEKTVLEAPGDFLSSSPSVDCAHYLHPASPAPSASDDKENWPVLTSSAPEMVNHAYTGSYLDLKNETDRVVPFCQDESLYVYSEDQETFEPLSFGSFQPGLRNAPYLDQMLSENDLEMKDMPVQSSVTLTDNTAPESLSFNNSRYLDLVSDPEILAHTLGIRSFAQLRAKRISEPQPIPAAQPVILTINILQENPAPPHDIFDKNTLRLPDIFEPVSSKHRYLASVELIQKHALVQALRSECSVELVERQSLDEVDLIIDPHCAIIFLSLFALPARCDAFVEVITRQSWRYSNILVIFEAYPEQQSKRTWRKGRTSAAVELYAFTPPILKALKKFRRDLTIADACGTKCPETALQYAFAENVRAGAQFVRMFGALAEERDETGGVIWSERDWLTAEISEEEEAQLASFGGLNHFSAFIILCQTSLQDFVDASPQARTDAFAGYIGLGAVMAFNDDLNSRLEAIQGSSAMATSELAEEVAYCG